MSNRPLSPHLQVYRLPLLPIVSILTRGAAIILFFGIPVFATWIIALGLGEEAYRFVTGILTSPLGLIALISWTLAFYWHMSNGIRHFIQDTGRALTIASAEHAAYICIVFTFVMTTLPWALIWGLS